MNEDHNTILTVPASGIAMDPSRLFGLERGIDGMVRAIGPEDRRSRWAVIPAVAEALVMSWIPHSGFIAHLQGSDAEDEALSEAYGFLRAWDMMAAGQTMAWMVARVRANTDDMPKFALAGIAKVEPREDGLVYLVLPNGDTSRCGIRPGAAVVLVSQWEGLDGAANLAAHYRGSAAAVRRGLMVRWDKEAEALSTRALSVAA